MKEYKMLEEKLKNYFNNSENAKNYLKKEKLKNYH